MNTFLTGNIKRMCEFSVQASFCMKTDVSPRYNTSSVTVERNVVFDVALTNFQWFSRLLRGRHQPEQ